jgi:hypothetical protein
VVVNSAERSRQFGAERNLSDTEIDRIVAETQQTQTALQESEQRFQLLVDAIEGYALRSVVRSRAALEWENLPLRQKIGVRQRSARKAPGWPSKSIL